MSAFAADTAKTLLGTARQELSDLGRSEIPRWVFALKICLAALLALWISLRFQLDSPRSAMITVVIVMQPHTGMVLEKSIYRFSGTVTGALASFLLVDLFVQQRVLFLVGLGLWIGLCTAGATFFRNHRSYGFVLAGYTAAIIGLFAVLHPEDVFPIAVTRLSEVGIGLLCAGFVSDGIFPRRLSDLLKITVRRRYRDFLSFVRASLSGVASPTELERMHLRLMDAVITVEYIRSAGALEAPEVRARDQRIRKLNSEFMAASTTFHSLHQLLKRLKKHPTPAEQALSELHESLGKTILSGEIPGSSLEAKQSARRIAATRVLLSRRVREMRRSRFAPGAESTLDFDAAADLLNRFLREMHACTQTYATLAQKKPEPMPMGDIRFALHTDPLVAFLNGGRAFAATLLAGTFWIASAWPHGIIALMNAAIVCALFASAPDPSRGVRQMIPGFGLGILAALIFRFLVMPSLDGFTLLCAGMVPFMLIGAYLFTLPNLAGIGSGYLIMLFYHLDGIGSEVFYSPVMATNDAVATIVGIAAAGIMFVTVAPPGGSWSKRRMARQLRQQVVEACFDPLAGLANRFESRIHDALRMRTAGGDVQGEGGRLLIAWTFSALEIGRTVIHLRQDAESPLVPQPVADSVQKNVASLARLFRRPSVKRRDAALNGVTDAIEVIRAEAEGPSCGKSLDRLQTKLHLIRTALQDEEAVPVSTTSGLLAATQGGPLHAP